VVGIAHYTGRPVNVGGVWRLSRKGFREDEATEAVLNWQQRIGRSRKRFFDLCRS